MAMYGSVVTPVWCNGDGHGNQSVILRLKNLKSIGQITSSPTLTNLLRRTASRNMAVIRREIGNKVLKKSVSGLVELNILKNLTVYFVAGSLGRFKSHASNIVFDVFIATCQDPAQNMESSQIDGSH
ncbi:hypothetical protein YC2023_056921 [Brassica napus]